MYILCLCLYICVSIYWCGGFFLCALGVPMWIAFVDCIRGFKASSRISFVDLGHSSWNGISWIWVPMRIESSLVDWSGACVLKVFSCFEGALMVWLGSRFLSKAWNFKPNCLFLVKVRFSCLLVCFDFARNFTTVCLYPNSCRFHVSLCLFASYCFSIARNFFFLSILTYYKLQYLSFFDPNQFVVSAKLRFILVLSEGKTQQITEIS